MTLKEKLLTQIKDLNELALLGEPLAQAALDAAYETLDRMSEEEEEYWAAVADGEDRQDEEAYPSAWKEVD